MIFHYQPLLHLHAYKFCAILCLSWKTRLQTLKSFPQISQWPVQCYWFCVTFRHVLWHRLTFVTQYIDISCFTDCSKTVWKSESVSKTKRYCHLWNGRRPSVARGKSWQIHKSSNCIQGLRGKCMVTRGTEIHKKRQKIHMK